ncbi:glutathione S-transferase family protein [Pseudomonas sp. GCM10022188]|uniref:glutathione S-transferase family protein n=1 Tax=Pseudomonas TaxID=286 RepID=UPI001E3FD5AD|nr:glutathione S-transferase N-terminal domain-containing protein [Pseudomonas oryzagri]MCC6075786.1 glutathione S-transferase N-terminal domain-containing protein [Pseudomonas oryzagri]
MTMRFYMTPGSCSTGIHILLEELELVFEAHIVDLLAGDHRKPAYLAINPNGTIPTLVLDDGTALTDFQAIAWWLARAYPGRQLIPADAEGLARVQTLLDLAGHEIHGQGFTRIFTTDRYAADPAEQAAVQAEGRARVARGFAAVAPLLAGRDYVTERFGIADGALFYVEFWAERIGIPLPEPCQAHYRRLLQRRAVRQVLAEEGYGAMLRRL